jgi:nodulation protein E
LLKRVAITGLGAISALGQAAAVLWQQVLGGRVGIAPIAGVPTDRLTVKIAAQANDFDPLRHFDARRLPMLDRTAQFALVAAREALRDAGLAEAKQRLARAGVVLGGGGGWTSVDEAYDQFYARDANRLHPFTVPRIMPSAPASHITIEHGIHGPAFTITSACASANHAIGAAFHMVRGGVLDLVITGGSDCSIAPGYLKGWDALRVLSPDTCRPFSKNRSGLVIGEGAGILVLEDLDLARARGARIYAELIGFGMNADAADMTAPDAASAAGAMTAALADAGIGADRVDYVNAHGTGTRLNDATEVAALKLALGKRLDAVAVSSTKSMIGHCMAAAGAIELVVTALAIHHGIAPPTMNLDEQDPECDIDCVPGAARPMPIEVAMSNSFAFGGLNAVLLARRSDTP